MAGQKASERNLLNFDAIRSADLNKVFKETLPAAKTAQLEVFFKQRPVAIVGQLLDGVEDYCTQTTMQEPADENEVSELLVDSKRTRQYLTARKSEEDPLRLVYITEDKTPIVMDATDEQARARNLIARAAKLITQVSFFEDFGVPPQFEKDAARYADFKDVVLRLHYNDKINLQVTNGILMMSGTEKPTKNFGMVNEAIKRSVNLLRTRMDKKQDIPAHKIQYPAAFDEGCDYLTIMIGDKSAPKTKTFQAIATELRFIYNPQKPGTPDQQKELFLQHIKSVSGYALEVLCTYR